MEVENTADSGFDLGAAMDAISTGTADPGTQTDTPAGDDLFDDKGAAGDDPAGDKPDEVTDPAAAAAPTLIPPPKSWAKEYHDDWSKLTPRVQEYYTQREKQMLDGTEQWRSEAAFAKEFKDVLTPYKPMLQAAGVSESQAISFLLNAQYRMTNGTAEERRAAYESIGQQLGFMQQAAGAQAQPVDPAVKKLQDELNQVKSTLTQQQQVALRDAQAKAHSEVEKFAADPANAYFNDVASDMVPFINQGFSLPEAYKKALRTNDVIHAKETARLQTEATEAAKKQLREETEAARKATGANVRGSDSRKAPTEPKGKMFDDMGDLLKEIKSRAN